jgi:RNA polymerase sigma-70 factor, ECF subfamily
LDSPEERQLVRSAVAGDYAAFEALVSRHERRLYALAWHLTHDHHDAQDVVQSSLLSAVEHLADFKGDSSFGTWITRIAVNNALKVLRGRRQHPIRPLEADDGDGEAFPVPEYIADWRDNPLQNLDRQELREILDDGIALLPEGQRLVFVLRDVQGMSVRETAEMLGISEGNVKVRLLRARLVLREFMTRRFGDEATRQERPADHDHGFLPSAAGQPKAHGPSTGGKRS